MVKSNKESSDNKMRATPPRTETKDRRYVRVPDDVRAELINLIDEHGMKVIDAASKLNIPYENAKLIYRIYLREGRIRQVPALIKRYSKLLKENPLGVSKIVTKGTFNKIQQTWADFRFGGKRVCGYANGADTAQLSFPDRKFFMPSSGDLPQLFWRGHPFPQFLVEHKTILGASL